METLFTISDSDLERAIAPIVRRCHVGESLHSVFTRVRKAFKKSAWRKYPRGVKKRIAKAAWGAHQKNRELYRAVVGGAL